MSIHFRCPNGHALKIAEHFAGHTAHCPSCKAPVVIPQQASRISEDAIADLLGPPAARSAPLSAANLPETVVVQPHHKRSLNEELAARGLKMCPKCHREVGIGYSVCIYCRTYFTDHAEMPHHVEAPQHAQHEHAHAPRR